MFIVASVPTTSASHRIGPSGWSGSPPTGAPEEPGAVGDTKPSDPAAGMQSLGQHEDLFWRADCAAFHPSFPSQGYRRQNKASAHGQVAAHHRQRRSRARSPLRHSESPAWLSCPHQSRHRAARPAPRPRPRPAPGPQGFANSLSSIYPKFPLRITEVDSSSPQNLIQRLDISLKIA